MSRPASRTTGCPIDGERLPSMTRSAIAQAIAFRRAVHPPFWIRLSSSGQRRSPMNRCSTWACICCLSICPPASSRRAGMVSRAKSRSSANAVIVIGQSGPATDATVCRSDTTTAILGLVKSVTSRHPASPSPRVCCSLEQPVPQLGIGPTPSGCPSARDYARNPNSTCCSSHTSGNRSSRSSSCSSAGCRPSRIASTISGASSVSRRTRLT